MSQQRSSLRLIVMVLLLGGLLVIGVLFWQNADLLGASDPLPTRALVAGAPSTPTAAVTAVSPTPTASSTPDQSPTPGPSPTPSSTPSQTPIPSPTPTSRPQMEPTLDATIAVGTLRDGIPTPATAIPTAVPTFEVPDGVTNILLLGSDTAVGDEEPRTDTLIIAAINRDTLTASLVSLPRDLYVYIPGGLMNRINTALARGESIDYEGGGIGLLEQTILYNFGIPIHYYARVDFEGFKQVVDAIDGVDVAVSCRLQDWRLKSPELDIEDEDNWEQFALEPGIHHMDGDLALWYVRSRLTTSDFDRGRRQQQLLRAIFNQGVDLGLISDVPSLWNTYRETVETDMDIGTILQLAALAPKIRENGIQHLYLSGKTESWVVPTSGAQVQLPIWEGDGMMQETFQRLSLPPALNRSTRAVIYVEIVNATDNPDLALLAADNLATYGFVPVIAPDAPQKNARTQIAYYGPNFKGSYEWLVSWIFAKPRSSIELISDESDYAYDYRVVLGDDYDPCRPQLYAPQAFLEQ